MKIVIIGGGVAGLAALNRLADLGVSATLAGRRQLSCP